MFRIRTPRFGLVSAAATVALAGFALTACTDGASSDAQGAGKGASAAVSSASGGSVVTPSAGVSSSVSVGGDSAPPAVPGKGSVAGKGSGSGGGAVTCDASNLKVGAAPLNRPVNHMLLTVTNAGSRTCYLYGYPALQFTGAQSVPPVMKDSLPQAVTTLEPGESGYASVALAAGDGSGKDGRTVKSLTVYFQGRSGSGSVGAGAQPVLPAKGVWIDDSLATTYWEQSMDDALSW
jgi:hypothetical protein